jgi:hypothetical protein
MSIILKVLTILIPSQNRGPSDKIRAVPLIPWLTQCSVRLEILGEINPKRGKGLSLLPSNND